MGAIVGAWISASLAPLAILRTFLGALEGDVRRFERDERRFGDVERIEEMERLEARLAELRRQ
jgi:hypothetical protein